MLHIQIESLRRKMGWSQAELAKRLHISPSSVGMYEQGRREPSIDILAALAKEFGVTIDYLVTGHVCPATDSRIINQAEHMLEALAEMKNLSRGDLLILLLAQMSMPLSINMDG